MRLWFLNKMISFCNYALKFSDGADDQSDINELVQMKYISRHLYTFLFSSIEERIKGKKRLIIIPDGVLAFLPFETCQPGVFLS